MTLTIVVTRLTGAQFPTFMVDAVRENKPCGKFRQASIERINLRAFIAPPQVGANETQYSARVAHKQDDANDYAVAMGEFFGADKVETLT